MISPLGQRQILQTAAVETVRQAMEGGALVQREQARRQSFEAHMAESLADVPEVPESDSLRLSGEPSRQRNRRDGQPPQGAPGEDPHAGVTGATPAEGAGPGLDLLA